MDLRISVQRRNCHADKTINFALQKEILLHKGKELQSLEEIRYSFLRPSLSND